jgi:hypothetical protein
MKFEILHGDGPELRALVEAGAARAAALFNAASMSSARFTSSDARRATTISISNCADACSARRLRLNPRRSPDGHSSDSLPSVLSDEHRTVCEHLVR